MSEKDRIEETFAKEVDALSVGDIFQRLTYNSVSLVIVLSVDREANEVSFANVGLANAQVCEIHRFLKIWGPSDYETVFDYIGDKEKRLAEQIKELMNYKDQLMKILLEQARKMREEINEVEK